MQRIRIANTDQHDSRTAELLAGVRRSMGGVPNLISTMAVSPAVAEAYLAFSQKLSTGVLDSTVRERIALTVAQAHGCDYCLAAHTMLGSRAGLSAAEVDRARRADAQDSSVAALLRFAAKLVSNRGRVEDQDVNELRAHGHSDAAIAEVVAHVALNTFTNFFNHVAATEVDFPAAPPLSD